MSDKQRADHAQAKYWNGYITRVEAQKVFDETAQVINAQAMAMQKFDAAISCLAEKLGVTPADVNAWITVQMEKAKAAQGEQPAQPEQPAQVANEPSPIVLTD